MHYSCMVIFFYSLAYICANTIIYPNFPLVSCSMLNASVTFWQHNSVATTIRFDIYSRIVGYLRDALSPYITRNPHNQTENRETKRNETKPITIHTVTNTTHRMNKRLKTQVRGRRRCWEENTHTQQNRRVTRENGEKRCCYLERAVCA